MIKLPYTIILLGATVLGGLSVNAQIYWSTNFTEAEDYQVGQTVIGVDGWVSSRIDGSNTDAGVFMHNDSPALRVISTGETTKNTRIYNAGMSVPDFAIQRRAVFPSS